MSLHKTHLLLSLQTQIGIVRNRKFIMEGQMKNTDVEQDGEEKVMNVEQGMKRSADGIVVQELKNVTATPSASSSPSHDFSFTISLHPNASPKIPDKNNKAPLHHLAIDLSPADEIFCHGQLLPLHLLSHLPVSPRSSTNSLDSFTLPINQLSSQHNISIDSTRSCDDQYINGVDCPNTCQEPSLLEPKGRRKSKSFSLFGLPKWRKGSKATDMDHPKDKRQKRKLRLDMSYVVKKYMRLVKPFLFRRGRNSQIHRQQPYSFSGNLEVKNNKELRKRRGEYSAPASMRTSPTNSGLLVASGTLTPTKSDSTMEELQAAIQAAIAHCKKSIAAEDNIKLP